jgi:hypothetical protein
LFQFDPLGLALHARAPLVMPAIGTFAKLRLTPTTSDYLASEGLFTPSIWKSGIAPDLDSILGSCQDNLRLVGFPEQAQPLIDQPKTVKSPTFSRSLGVNCTPASSLAVLAPNTLTASPVRLSP